VQPSSQQAIPFQIAEQAVTPDGPTTLDLPAGYDFILTALILTNADPSTPSGFITVQDENVGPTLWAETVDFGSGGYLSRQGLSGLCSGGTLAFQTSLNSVLIDAFGWLIGPTGSAVTVTLE